MDGHWTFRSIKFIQFNFSKCKQTCNNWLSPSNFLCFFSSTLFRPFCSSSNMRKSFISLDSFCDFSFPLADHLTLLFDLFICIGQLLFELFFQSNQLIEVMLMLRLQTTFRKLKLFSRTFIFQLINAAIMPIIVSIFIFGYSEKSKMWTLNKLSLFNIRALGNLDIECMFALFWESTINDNNDIIK